MYYVYILKSQATGKYYIGSSEDIEDRIKRHNRGGNKSTKHGIPWSLVYSKGFKTRQEAYKMEFKLKSYKGGETLKRLIS